jgi:TorA maturation chaperone TorD
MALPNASVVKTAVENLYAALAEDKTKSGARSGVQALNQIQHTLNTLYPVAATIAQTDAADANVAAFIGAGEGAVLVAGSVYRQRYERPDRQRFRYGEGFGCRRQ